MSNHIMPMVDILIDLHSGGSTLLYCLVVHTRLSEVNQRKDDCMAALRAFDAPFGFVTFDDRDTRYASYPAMLNGAVALSGEFGSSRHFYIEGGRIIERGVGNVLAHFGVLDRPTLPRDPADSPMQLVRDVGGSAWADEDGIFEPHVRLGDEVDPGETAGRMWRVEAPEVPPVVKTFDCGGRVICMRAPAQFTRRDMLVRLVKPYGDDA